MMRCIKVLTTSDVARANAVLEGLSSFLIDRGRLKNCFLTLGAASYLDARNGQQRIYAERAQRCNRVLLKHFDWLYSRLAKSLELALCEATYFEPGLALPGFHIWKAPSIFVRPNASIHFDMQYRNLQWPDRCGADFSKLISFTLPIRLPAGGGGLNAWDISYDAYLAAYAAKRVTKVEEMPSLVDKPMVFCPYETGTLYLSFGLTLHQIAPVDRVDPADARITLQGHGVLCNRRWLLYW